MRVLISLFLIFIIGGCAKKSTTSINSSMQDYENLAYEVLNVKPIEFSKNSSNDYVLATYYKTNSNVTGTEVLNYAIINIERNQVEKKGVLPQGRINWISDYQVEIFSPPGITKNPNETPDDYTEIYDVKTGKTTSKKGARN
jgi:hypothetical protein